MIKDQDLYRQNGAQAWKFTALSIIGKKSKIVAAIARYVTVHMSHNREELIIWAIYILILQYYNPAKTDGWF